MDNLAQTTNQSPLSWGDLTDYIERPVFVTQKETNNKNSIRRKPVEAGRWHILHGYKEYKKEGVNRKEVYLSEREAADFGEVELYDKEYAIEPAKDPFSVL